MKEVTYEDWMKNPTPRMMWVWNKNVTLKKKRKVVYFSKENFVDYPVIGLQSDDSCVENFQHCAEIEKSKTRRMTNKELSRWLREKPTREYKYSDVSGNIVSCFYAYFDDYASKELQDDILIREDDSEWREPLVEVKE